MSDPTPGNIESTFVTKTKDPIDEHALLIAVRQNARIARLAEPLQAYWIGARVATALECFVIGMQTLSSPVTIVFQWEKIRAGLS
jgi:hypothetical protein